MVHPGSTGERYIAAERVVPSAGDLNTQGIESPEMTSRPQRAPALAESLETRSGPKRSSWLEVEEIE